MKHLRTILISLLIAAGCDGAPAITPCSEAEARTCLIDQQACSMASGTAECVACDPGMRASATGACIAIAGTALHHEFPEISTENGGEISGMCRSWTLGNETELWVNVVEMQQDEASHHSNWTYAPEDQFAGEDGLWPCDDRGYDQVSGALAGGVLYAQSTQASHEVQAFPTGAAIRIPPHARIIGDVHVLNLTGAPVAGNVALTLYSIPPDQVTVPLLPFHITYQDLDIPARSRARYSMECDIPADYEAQVGRPFDVRLYYALPHTHSLATRIFLQAVGGPRDGEYLVDVSGYNGEARGIQYEPPLDLTGVTALRFGCEFDNPRAENVGWGIGDQEMCEMLGFLAGGALFESATDETTMTGMDGDMHTFSGPCESFVIPRETAAP